MKKVIALLFIVVIGIGITGCDVASGNNQNAEDVPNNVSGNTSEKIELTPENIYDYLTISLNVSDVEKEYLGVENSVAEGKITIKTSPRKRGDFNDVIITGTLKTSSAGWVADGKWDTREKSLLFLLMANMKKYIE